MNNQAFQPRTNQVLNLIKCHSEKGITTREMADILGKPIKQIYSSIETLTGRKLIKKGGKHIGTVWWIPSDAPMLPVAQPIKKAPNTAHLHRPKTDLVAAVDGPGHTKMKAIKLDPPAVLPIRPGTMGTMDTPPEMICVRGDGEAALRVPSVVDGVRYARVKPSLICVGAESIAMQAGSARRFSA